MKLIAMALLISISVPAFASAIQINNDENDCVDGWISMDVTVEVGSESFRFDPSCSFSFDDQFTTSSGVECKVEAGMCSNFSPEKRFEVSCDDGSSSGVDIKCPAK